MGHFRIHGRLLSSVSGRVLYMEATGPFNSEAVNFMLATYRPLLEELAGKGPYGHICTFHESMMFTSGAVQAFEDLIRAWKLSGILPSAVAHVAASDVEGRQIMVPIFARQFADLLPFRDFHTMEAAETWVTQGPH